MAPATNNLILLTGATGFIGFRTLIDALKAGYNVRCAIRSESKASGITSAPALKALNLPDSAVTFSIVPDISVAGAYDEAIQGVTHVIHVASPLPRSNVGGHTNAEEVFIKPAVSGALEILKAAKRTAGIQKVVITSSVVALIKPKLWAGVEQTDQVFTPDSRLGNQSGPYENEGEAYSASKIASLNATDEWVKKEKPSFGVVNVHPSWVIGPADLARSREEFFTGTNRFVASIATGKFGEMMDGRNMTGATVHVDDIARMHVSALKPEVTGYQGFIGNVPMEWNNIAKVVADNFPKAVKDGEFVEGGKVKTAKINFDATATLDVLGVRLRGIEEQTKDALEQYLKLPEKV